MRDYSISQHISKFNQLPLIFTFVGDIMKFPCVDWGKDDFNKVRFGEVVRSMECAALLGADIIVVHPVHKNMPKSVDEYAVKKVR